MKIASNITNEITHEEIKGLEKATDGKVSLEFDDYREKGVDLTEIAKFIIQNINIREVIIGSLTWELARKLFLELIKLARKKKRREINFWIVDLSNLSPINIAFSASEENIDDIVNGLKKEIEINIFKNKREKKKNKFLWLTFDKDNKKWVLKEF